MVERELSAGDPAVHQSNIHRLEQGSIADPSAAILSAVAKVSSDNGDVLSETERYNDFVACLVEDKYHINRELCDLLRRNPKTLKQLAEWEAQQSHVWVVAQKTVDAENLDFRRSVQEILKSGGRVVFFIPKHRVEDAEYHKDRVCKNDDIDASSYRIVGLSNEQQGVLAASFVVSNPESIYDPESSDKDPEGYIILNNERAEPLVALELFEEEIREKVDKLERYLESAS